ncbi:MAG: dihydropteroate synthase [Methylophilaceae bacterium]
MVNIPFFMPTINHMIKTKKSPLIMGILNVTPDSFSDGGHFFSPKKAIDHAYQMLDEGADMIDIGGESTKPGALPVSIDEEIARIKPVLEALKNETNLYLSLDTNKAKVMELGLDLGVSMINDVYALRNEGAMDVIAKSSCDVCLMHMQGKPQTMQTNPQYNDVVNEVKSFLSDRINACLKNDIHQDRIVIDPGFGFGKTFEDNLNVFNSITQFQDLKSPMLIGISRKSMIRTIIGDNEDDIIQLSAFMAALAAQRGASILRVHDVKETQKALNYFS